MSPVKSTIRPELWAKTNRPDIPEELLHLPLYDHGVDAADAARMILEQASPNIKIALAQDLALSPQDLAAFVEFLAATHDVGKASPKFQQQVPSLYAHAEELGYPAIDRPGDLDNLPHSIHGMAIISRWLQQNYGYTGPKASSVAVMSGGHHGRFPETGILNTLRKNPGNPKWVAAQDEMLTGWTAKLEATQALKLLAATGVPAKCQLILTGLVILADWAASNSSIFALRSGATTPDHLTRIREAQHALGLPATWSFGKGSRSTSGYYASRFNLPPGAQPSLMQETFFRMVSSATSPELYILEAPTGSGKTEMALAAAEQLASNLGLNGVAFALPTMATTDAMLPRILDWLKAATPDGSGTPTVTLGHGKARFSPQLEALPRQLLHSCIIHDEDTSSDSPTFLVHHFFSDRKRVLQPNISVVTIDQVLMAALNTKHYTLRHLGLASKVVVIDEVHAADAYMLTFLHRILEWLSVYGVPVILMSATLPAQQRRSLAKAYYSRAAPDQFRGKRSDAINSMMAELIPERLGYPCVTQVSSAGLTMSHSVLVTTPVPVQPIQVPDELEALWDLLEPRIASGGVIGIICNTVARAQAAFQFIRSKLPNNTVLAHSRFITADRLEIERLLVETLGPEHSGAVRPLLQVVVGTSVLEQSLDIDFDLLVSDLAPMDLLLQRAGRLQRHIRGNRCPGFRQPELWLRGVDDWERSHSTILRSVSVIYGEFPLLNTLAVFEQHSAWDTPLRHPHQAADLVQEAYAADLVYPPIWRKDHDEYARVAAAQLAKKEAKAKTGLIPAPKPSLDLFIDRATESGTAVDAKTRNLSGPAREEAEAVTRVRDIEDSFEVLLMTREQDTISGLPWQEHLQLSLTGVARIEDFELARQILRNSVRLPMSFSKDFTTLDKTLTELESQGLEAWQENQLLKGQLVLFLNQKCETTLADHHIRYDRQLGLIVTPPQKGNGP
ncbi:CRISPR-associated helicase Cas3' [Arthrobacter sp. MYb227]|uniref:CRISPR-associated helicase Cas3' n=1 Tax=Arthrobacter sp. MYb227 TaxID=1848601 RepID=UPI0015E2CDD6|nr:CRISPR-associated helicase Cas3' [Arthrobacter sp. MYb227]